MEAAAAEGEVSAEVPRAVFAHAGCCCVYVLLCVCVALSVGVLTLSLLPPPRQTPPTSIPPFPSPFPSSPTRTLTQTRSQSARQFPRHPVIPLTQTRSNPSSILSPVMVQERSPPSPRARRLPSFAAPETFASLADFRVHRNLVTICMAAAAFLQAVLLGSSVLVVALNNFFDPPGKTLIFHGLYAIVLSFPVANTVAGQLMWFFYNKKNLQAPICAAGAFLPAVAFALCGAAVSSNEVALLYGGWLVGGWVGRRLPCVFI